MSRAPSMVRGPVSEIMDLEAGIRACEGVAGAEQAIVDLTAQRDKIEAALNWRQRNMLALRRSGAE